MNAFISLEELHIAKPCRADWHHMTGDERARFCGSCHKNVYDISQMTRAQAHALIAEKEGGVCVRLHRRPDGTVITSDCPVGIATPPRPLWWGVAALMALVGTGLSGCTAATTGTPVQGDEPAAPTLKTPQIETRKAEPVAVSDAHGERVTGVTLGRIFVPQSPPKSAPTPQASPQASPQATTAPLAGAPLAGAPLAGAPMLMGEVSMGAPSVPATDATQGVSAPICPRSE